MTSTDEKPLFIQETFLNKTEGHALGESEVYEAYTSDPAELFTMCQREYGRCTGRVYIDVGSTPVHVGWVFQKKMRYEDTNEKYVREVWVTLFDQPDTIVRTHHYHRMGKKNA